jgi:hypothetical protein
MGGGGALSAQCMGRTRNVIDWFASAHKNTPTRSQLLFLLCLLIILFLVSYNLKSPPSARKCPELHAGRAASVGVASGGVWARVTVDKFRPLAMQTLQAFGAY